MPTGTTPASATYDQIAQTRSSRFVDTQVTIGTTYYYWVNAYDTVENVSGFSSRVSAIATAVSGTLDTTAPSTPSAPTFSSETTYTASDGSVFARVVINVPAMPTEARPGGPMGRRQLLPDVVLEPPDLGKELVLRGVPQVGELLSAD